MKLVSMRIHNFMPYRGDHELDFPQSSAHNVMIVWGDNGRGKTSLLNAMRWCFYGHALDRDRQAVPLMKLINSSASASGDWSASVTTTFLHEGGAIELTRAIAKRDLVSIPRADADFTVQMFLSKDGTQLSHDLAVATIQTILPEDISRFFLFDAELLQEYEDLLVEDRDQGKRIRDSIDQVLGVPALTRGRVILKTLLKRAQAQLAKDTEHTKGLEAQAEHFQRLTAEREAISLTVEHLRTKEAEQREITQRLEEELKNTEGYARFAVEADTKRRELKAAKERAEEIKVDTTRVAANAWRDLLQPKLRARLTTLTGDLNKMQSQIQAVGAVSAKVTQMQSIASGAACPVCTMQPDAGRRTAAAATLAEVEAQLGKLTTASAAFTSVAAEVEVLSRIQGTDAQERLRALDAQAAQNALAITALETAIAELDTKIAGFDAAEDARRRHQHKQSLGILARIEIEIEKGLADIEDRQTKINALASLLAKAPSARSTRTAHAVQLYQDLNELFTGGVDELRERLRKIVEGHATKAFTSLAAEKAYSGLKINESYGLVMVDSRKREIPMKSAGYEQIVALSLIDALTRTARREAPVVMDTPLSRLDSKHRAKVLAFIPHMAGQVILLVHDGEVSDQKSLAPLAGSIGASYEIVRRSETESALVRKGLPQ